MPRPKNTFPTYRLHKQSGQAVTTVRLPDGRRRDVLLGRYQSPESKAEYQRVLAELSAAPEAVAVSVRRGGPAGHGGEVLRKCAGRRSRWHP